MDSVGIGHVGLWTANEGIPNPLWKDAKAVACIRRTRHYLDRRAAPDTGRFSTALTPAARRYDSSRDSCRAGRGGPVASPHERLDPMTRSPVGDVIVCHDALSCKRGVPESCARQYQVDALNALKVTCIGSAPAEGDVSIFCAHLLDVPAMLGITHPLDRIERCALWSADDPDAPHPFWMQYGLRAGMVRALRYDTPGIKPPPVRHVKPAPVPENQLALFGAV